MEVYPTIDKELVTDDETLDELVEKASRSDSSSSSVPQSSPPSSVASSQRYYITFENFQPKMFYLVDYNLLTNSSLEFILYF